MADRQYRLQFEFFAKPRGEIRTTAEISSSGELRDETPIKGAQVVESLTME
jgi:hypothetical protein